MTLFNIVMGFMTGWCAMEGGKQAKQRNSLGVLWYGGGVLLGLGLVIGVHYAPAA